jgi:apolipoprotein N-acyltransferase
LGWVAFVSLIPLGLVFRVADWKAASIAGLAFGIVFFGLLFSWITLFGLPAFIALLTAEVFWVVVSMHAGVTARKNLPSVLWIGIFPLALLVGEWMRARFPVGGFTWGGFGYSQHDNLPFLRLAAYAGVWGLSAAVVVINALFVEALVRLWARRAISGAGMAAAGVVVMFFPMILPVSSPDGEAVTVAMVQGNLPLEGSVPEADDPTVLGNHVDLTRRLEPGTAALVIWPESTLDRDPTEEPEFEETIRTTARRVRAPLLVGTSMDVGTDYFRNVSMFFDRDGRLIETYDKIHLVPYGEYVPGRRFLEPLIKELELVPRDGLPGSEPVVFEIPQGKFASVICFESIFPGLVRQFVEKGARLLVVSTNNSSFERSAASEQHIAFSQVRAAEHRMWVAHAALSGISGVVDPDGKVIEKTGLFTQALLTPTVRFATRKTLYAAIGDWLPALASVFMVAVLLSPLVDVVRKLANSRGN